MEIVTSWMEQGIQQGQAEGSQQEAINFALRLLRKKFGEIGFEIEIQVRKLPVARLEELGEALFDLSSIAEVATWLEHLNDNNN
jgi:hypothetical protein